MRAVGKKRVTSSVRPCGDRALGAVMEWTVSGEMLMPSRTASKLGLVWNDSAAWMSVQAAIRRKKKTNISRFVQRPEADGISAIGNDCYLSYR